MWRVLRWGVSLLVMASSPLFGQQLPRGQALDLNRPTTSSDETPLLDFDKYFIEFSGVWKFEWDVPDSPLGPGGTIEGTTTYRALDRLDGGVRFYEARTEATGPAGPVKQTEIISYNPDHKALSRVVTDSRGFSFLQAGSIGGDLGGYYNLYLDSPTFAYKRSSVRLKSLMILYSPVRYKVQTMISVDGGPFKNFGLAAWWEKQLPAAGKAKK